jgi:flagella basal body P-ring formation protein FlgA
MKRIWPHIFAFGLALSVASVAVAGVRLNDNPTVKGGQITVGDVFSGSGTAARGQLGPAPAPGQTVVYNARHLAAIARAYGLDWEPKNRGQVLVITSALRVLEKHEITDIIADELKKLDVPGEIRVELTGRNAVPRLLVYKDAPAARVNQIEFDRHTGRIHASLVLPGHSNEIRFQGRAEIAVEVPVVTRTIRRGETVAENDVDWLMVRMTGLPTGLVMSDEDLVGMSARRTLRPGKAIRDRELRTPILVRKGQQVVMELNMPGMKLSGSGRALGDAAKGETVQIMNTRSKRTVEGVVIGPDKVVIPMRRQVAVATAK